MNKKGFYVTVIKRLFDIVCSFMFILVFWWILLIIALKVRKNLGRPVFFKQPRPGMIDPKTGRERVFEMIKFRTMSDEKDEKGDLLPNEERIDDFGRALRATSLDELPELFNILKGEMSIIGPRPQLVKDMVFMTDEQRVRHTVKPGLTGLAQVKGRNAISWEEKFEYDVEYVNNISFREDLMIFWKTVEKMILRKSSEIPNVEIDFAPDYGDDLLMKGKITLGDYLDKQEKARDIIAGFERAK